MLMSCSMISSFEFLVLLVLLEDCYGRKIVISRSSAASHIIPTRKSFLLNIQALEFSFSGNASFLSFEKSTCSFVILGGGFFCKLFEGFSVLRCDLMPLYASIVMPVERPILQKAHWICCVP